MGKETARERRRERERERERRSSMAYIEEPGGESVHLEGRVRHCVLVEIGVVLDAHCVDAVRQVWDAIRRG